MAQEIKIDIKNEDQLMQLFEELTPQKQKEVAVKALKQSAKIIMAQVKSNFQGVKQGFSKSNYSNVVKTLKTVAMYRVLGVKVGFSGRDAYKAHWIEWGANNAFGAIKGEKEGRYQGRHSMFKKYTGVQEPRPFFFKAVESKSQEANNSLQGFMIKEMENVVKKYGGQA